MSGNQKVWTKFSGKNTDLKFCILSPPEDRKNEALDLYLNNFVAEETMCKASGVAKSIEAKAEYIETITETLINNEQTNIMICCIEKEDSTLGKLVGVSISYLTTSDKRFNIEREPKTNETAKLRELWFSIIPLYDNLGVHKVDKCYDGFGIIVHPDYRGLGIAQEFLKARRLLSKDQGVPITGAWMTSIATQKAAERDGYQTVYEFDFEDFGKKHNVTIETVAKSCKYMVYKVL